jgi:hypothetical protein
VYIPRGFHSTAQYTHWMRASLNNTLDNVNMWYDYDSDAFSYYKGKVKAWSPPV